MEPEAGNRKEQHRQQQSLEDMQIQGDGNVLNILQGRDVQVVNLSVYDHIPEVLGKLFIKNINSVDPKDFDSRKVLLNKVKKYWIQGVLENSLHANALIELGLEERLDAIQDPFNRIQAIPAKYRHAPIQDKSIDDVFIQMGKGRTLLILGEPGSGKTITLLKLAKTFISYAEEDLSKLIPVVFNLSSWLGEKQTIKDWLIDELQSKYQVSKSLGETWITSQQLLLLLDGLDEVAALLRESCVEAINIFLQEYGQTEMVICSRIKDYESLTVRLRLQGAILIKSLTTEQVNQYLDIAGKRLAAVRTLLHEDTTLQDLSKSPLMLSIISLSYQNADLENLKQVNQNKRYQHLINTYISQMFNQHRINDHQFNQEKVIHWLNYLARKMIQESQSIFLIEKMQPSWLETKQIILYRSGLVVISGIIGSFMSGLSAFFCCGFRGDPGDGLSWQVFNELYWNLDDALRWMSLISITGGLMSAIFVGSGDGIIEPIEAIKFSWKDLKKSILSRYTLNRSLVSGILFSFAFSFDKKPISSAFLGLFIGLTLGFSLAVSFGLKSSEIEDKTTSNQGIWQSAANAYFSGLCSGLLGGMVVGLAFELLGERLELGLGNYGFPIGFLAGFTCFALFGTLLNKAGKACQRHITLRLVLWSQGYIPWNYSKLLSYVTDRIFMQQVGGGYIFIHRALLEYFANNTSQESN